MRATTIDVVVNLHRFHPVGGQHEQAEGHRQQAHGAAQRQLHAPAVPDVRDDGEQILWQGGVALWIEHEALASLWRGIRL